MFVCICNAVSDKDIQQAVAEGASSLECLRERLAVATQCGGCAEHAEEVLSNTLSERAGGQFAMHRWQSTARA